MKPSHFIALISIAAIAPAQAVLIASDDFDGLTAGTAMDASTDWNAKWVTASTQQNLFKADGAGGIDLDTSIADIQYRGLHQTGFVVGGGGFSSVTISFDFNYTHNGLGNPGVLNEAFFGPMVSDQPQWWNGANEEFRIVNRGGAIGNRLDGSPFVENWVNHTALGVDPNVGGTSSNLNVQWTLTDNGTTIDNQITVTHGGGSFTSTLEDTGIASGTTLYGGFSTGWNGSGAGSIEGGTNISNINLDNFAINGVPEPSAALLAGLAALTLVRRRR